MKSPTHPSRWILGSFLLHLSWDSLSWGSTFFPQPFPKTVQEAPVIIKGTIGTSYADWGKGSHSQRIYTFSQLEPDEVLKGDIPSRSGLVIRELGGEKDGTGLIIDGAAHFESGEKVIVFLKTPNPDGSLDVHGMMMGKLNFELSPQGEELLTGPALWRGQPSHPTTPNTSRWTLADLKLLIRNQAEHPPSPSPVTQAVGPRSTEASFTSPLPAPAPTPSPATARHQGGLQIAFSLLLLALGTLGVVFRLWRYRK